MKDNSNESFSNLDYLEAIIWGVVLFTFSFISANSILNGEQNLAMGLAIVVGIAAGNLQIKLSQIIENNAIREKEDKLQ